MLVSGRVQGVGFRYFVQDIAALERISGWTRNLPDGHVEVFAEGDAEALDRFERQVRRGPGRARVQDVRVSEEAPSGRPGGFVIREG
jgi:acylphosphatase